MGIAQEDMAMFLAVAREGSFGRAAATLLMAQPSVSERMVRLERTLGGALFVRGARGVRLTDAGERLLPYAQRMLDLCEEADQAVRRGDRLPPLRVGVHVTFAHRAVPVAVAIASVHRRPVAVRDAHTDEVIAMLLDGVVDVGFVLPGARPHALRSIALPPDPVIAVCGRSHPLAGRTVGLRAVASFSVALNRWGAGAEEFCTQLEAAGLPDWRRTECSDGHTALGLARDQGYVALVTASIAAPALESGTVARLSLRPAPRWTVPLAFAYMRRSHHDPLIVGLRSAFSAP